MDRYDGPNQDTKREIIRYLYNNPDREHDPEAVFRAVRTECRASKLGTVENQLSKLANNEEQIELEKRSYYRWNGLGSPRPNRRFQEVRAAVKDWLNSLNYSLETIGLAFVVWGIGFLIATISLVSLFTSSALLGLSFESWFFLAGLFTILGSTMVMVWIPLYILDVLRARGTLLD